MKSPSTSLTKNPVSTPAGKFPFSSGEFIKIFPSIRPHFTMFHELQVLCICFEENRTNEAIDPVGDFSSLCFPMEVSGGKVAGYLQNTSATIVLIGPAISRMSGVYSVNSCRSPVIFCSTLARTFHLPYILSTGLSFSSHPLVL